MTAKVIVFGFSSFCLLKIIFCDCPENSVPWNSQCFTFYSNSTGFADAELKCTKNGGHLASIHDGFTNALIAQEAKSSFLESTEADFWIGATNLMSPKSWNWTDGSPFDFNDWKPGEPQNATGSNCAAISLADGYWSAQDCFKSKPFVCSTSASPTYPPLYANCTPGWSYFAPTHSCYGVGFGGFKSNWSAAQSYCESLNAELPSIHSVAEFQYISSYVYVSWADIWTSIFTTDYGKHWISLDGSTADFLEYSEWCTSSNFNLTSESCVLVGVKNDGNCYFPTNCYSDERRTICKKTIQ